MKRIVRIGLSLFMTAGLAFGWGSEGHMIVAELAYQKLLPAVKTKIAALLKLNPNYPDWINGVAAADQAETAFLIAATWPDKIKSMKGYSNDGEHPKAGGTAGRNIGYTDKLQHRYWHFYDTPISADGTPAAQPASPNAQTQIALFRSFLAVATNDQGIRSYDLVWLIHVVGDVHQPLHAASRFDKAQPDGDEGGNDVSICITASSCSGELHGYWDDIPGTSSVVAAVKTKAAKIPAADATKAKVSDEKTWIADSAQLAQTVVYKNPPIAIGSGPYTLTAAYKTAAAQLADQQLALAGARLANLLNDALK
ncbi:MAG TPA: S1/P1 nuclease [Bryobacteraceae bacterium]|nr:S1/P1 nuclease [Bryobacteraceae bacterium]